MSRSLWKFRRPDDHQAAWTSPVWRVAPTGRVTRSSVSRSERRCRCPLTPTRSPDASPVAARLSANGTPSQQPVDLLQRVLSRGSGSRRVGVWGHGTGLGGTRDLVAAATAGL